MKKMVKFLGLIAFAAIIGFSIVSCDNGTTGGGTEIPDGGGSGGGGQAPGDGGGPQTPGL